LAAAGEAGVDHVLRLLKDEVDRTLAQIGCGSPSQLSPDYVMADAPMPTTASHSVHTSQKHLDDFVLNGGISPRGREPSAIGTKEEMHHEHS
jgi:hypothetical protein